MPPKSQPGSTRFFFLRYPILIFLKIFCFCLEITVFPRVLFFCYQNYARSEIKFPCARHCAAARDWARLDQVGAREAFPVPRPVPAVFTRISTALLTHRPLSDDAMAHSLSATTKQFPSVAALQASLLSAWCGARPAARGLRPAEVRVRSSSGSSPTARTPLTIAGGGGSGAKRPPIAG